MNPQNLTNNFHRTLPFKQDLVSYISESAEDFTLFFILRSLIHCCFYLWCEMGECNWIIFHMWQVVGLIPPFIYTPFPVTLKFLQLKRLRVSPLPSLTFRLGLDHVDVRHVMQAKLPSYTSAITIRTYPEQPASPRTMRDTWYRVIWMTCGPRSWSRTFQLSPASILILGCVP